MEDIKVTFLGTGNAVPTQLRNHTSILVNYKSDFFLFDCGEGTQRQFKFAQASFNKITKLFITHWHGDHTLGIPGLLQTLAMSEYSKTLEIYGPKGTKHFIEIIEKLMGKIKIKYDVKEVSPGIILENKEYSILAESGDHDTPSLAYSFIIKDQIRLDKKKIKKLKLPNSPILGQLQSGKDIIIDKKKIKSKEVTYIEKGKKLTIILDTLPTPKLTNLAKNSNLLICESSFADQESDKARDYKHLTAKQAAQIAKESKSEKLVLTHISQRYEHNTKIIEKEAKSIFKNTHIVKDLDKIVI